MVEKSAAIVKKLKMANNIGNVITKILADETASSVTMLCPSILILNSLFVFLKTVMNLALWEG